MPKNGLRKVAAGAALALAATSLGAMTSPAQAETGATDYTCTVLGNPQTFSVNTDTDAPKKMVIGEKTQPLTVTSTVVIPGSLAGLMYTIGVRTADGSAVADSTINGVKNVTNLTVPTTELSPTGDLTVVATGTGKRIKAKKAGKLAIVAGDFISTLNLYKEDGTPALEPQEVPCSAAPTTIDTIRVVKAKSKTNASVKYAKAKKKFTIKAKVKAPVKATGKVKFVITKNGKKFKTVKAKVNKRGAAKANVKRIKKGKYVVKAKYLGSKKLKPSTAKVKKRV